MITTFDPAVFAGRLEASLDRPAMLPVTPGLPLGTHFHAIRHNYIELAQRVCEGLETWERSERNLIAPWHLLMTPIEMAVWEEIRKHGLPFWPQYPAGRYFLDFACPVACVGIECDGLEFHDKAKDAVRDAALARLGWTIYRVPGWQCVRQLDDVDADVSTDEWDQHLAQRSRHTVHGVLDLIAAIHWPDRPVTVGGRA